MKLAVIAIGIPGSGKTTLLTPLAQEYGLARISRDDIREELFGDPFDRSAQDLVMREANARMHEEFAEGTGIVLDSTFVSRDKRMEAISEARSAGAERIIGVVFNTPLDVAKERNSERDRSVREEVIDKLHAKFESEPPTLSDGFDVLYTDGQLAEIERDIQVHSS